MTVPSSILDMDPGLSEWCILHGYRGSIAHGMWEPSSRPDSIDDKDTMAVCVPPIETYAGCGDFPTIDQGHKGYFREYANQGTREIKEGEWDVVVYEVRKAIWLLMMGNPNMLSLLWLPQGQYLYPAKDTDQSMRAVAGRALIQERDLFVGRHVYQSFTGYAKDQLYKMEHNSTQGYMGEKRKALVEKYGYDTKNAAHLVRLLRVLIEFLQDGFFRVDRGGVDATELLAIKHGEWTLVEVEDEATRLFRRAEDMNDRSTLPRRPDEKKIQELCVDIVTSVWGG